MTECEHLSSDQLSRFDSNIETIFVRIPWVDFDWPDKTFSSSISIFFSGVCKSCVCYFIGFVISIRCICPLTIVKATECVVLYEACGCLTAPIPTDLFFFSPWKYWKNEFLQMAVACHYAFLSHYASLLYLDSELLA